MADVDVYEELSHERWAALPTVFRDGLLTGQVVLVTGGAGGIGRAVCYLFARLGATIAACGRNPPRLAWLAEGLERLGAPCSTHVMTIRDPVQVGALLDAVWDRHGRLDVLINNAGASSRPRRSTSRPRGGTP